MNPIQFSEFKKNVHIAQCDVVQWYSVCLADVRRWNQLSAMENQVILGSLPPRIKTGTPLGKCLVMHCVCMCVCVSVHVWGSMSQIHVKVRG